MLWRAGAAESQGIVGAERVGLETLGQAELVAAICPEAAPDNPPGTRLEPAWAASLAPGPGTYPLVFQSADRSQ